MGKFILCRREDLVGLGQELLEGFLDLIFPRPRRCPLCQGEVGPGGEVPCLNCRSRVRLVTPPYCQRCGLPLEGKATCPDCRNIRLPFVQARAAGIYTGVLRECLHRFKYRKELSFLPYLQGLLGDCLQMTGVPPVDVVVPVPLHRQREWQRGFNQAALLGEGVARHLALPLVSRSLVRTRPTPPTSGMTRQEREKHLKEAFKVQDRLLKGKAVLLVDDIYTTRTTAAQCTQAMLDGGAREVYVLAVAAVPKDL